MKLSYYHYFFKQRRKKSGPRISRDLQPFLKAFVDYDDTDWKKDLVAEDGETTMLIPTTNAKVYMLIATRRQDIIKAVNTNTLSAEDVAERLKENEETGFAAYLRADASKIGLASTLRAPRTAALSRFINQVMAELGVEKYYFGLQSLTTSVTLEQAKAMAHVASTSVTLEPGSGLRQQIIDYLALDKDVGTVQVVIKGKRNQDIKEILDKIDKRADTIGPNRQGGGLSKFVVRGKAAADEQMADFFIEGDGRYSEEIETGSEPKIISSLSTKFAHSEKANNLLEQVIEENVYDENPVPDLDILDSSDDWGDVLDAEAAPGD